MLNIVKFKGCKRCGGDLFLERDSEGIYITCLQCSATYSRRLTPVIKRPRARRKRVYAR
jgi:DNA-directed RNA polymerase subunit RPC12/RpoP